MLADASRLALRSQQLRHGTPSGGRLRFLVGCELEALEAIRARWRGQDTKVFRVSGSQERCVSARGGDDYKRLKAAMTARLRGADE